MKNHFWCNISLPFQPASHVPWFAVTNRQRHRQRTRCNELLSYKNIRRYSGHVWDGSFRGCTFSLMDPFDLWATEASWRSHVKDAFVAGQNVSNYHKILNIRTYPKMNTPYFFIPFSLSVHWSMLGRLWPAWWLGVVLVMVLWTVNASECQLSVVIISIGNYLSSCG